MAAVARPRPKDCHRCRMAIPRHRLRSHSRGSKPDNAHQRAAIVILSGILAKRRRFSHLICWWTLLSALEQTASCITAPLSSMMHTLVVSAPTSNPAQILFAMGIPTHRSEDRAPRHSPGSLIELEVQLALRSRGLQLEHIRAGAGAPANSHPSSEVPSDLT
jgi:hypothetical protein